MSESKVASLEERFAAIDEAETEDAGKSRKALIGLIIAIPALIFWRYFRARVDEYLLTLEQAGERLLQHLATLRTPS